MHMHAFRSGEGTTDLKKAHPAEMEGLNALFSQRTRERWDYHWYRDDEQKCFRDDAETDRRLEGNLREYGIGQSRLRSEEEGRSEVRYFLKVAGSIIGDVV